MKVLDWARAKMAGRNATLYCMLALAGAPLSVLPLSNAAAANPVAEKTDTPATAEKLQKPEKAERPDKAIKIAARTIRGDRARTRFVIALEKEVKFHVSSLQNPNRVIVDLPEVKLQLPTITGDKPVGLVKSFRGGLASPGRMRVVIDVTDPVVVENTRLEPGKDGHMPRLVLEIVPVDATRPGPKKTLATAAMAQAGLASVQPPLPKPAERPETRAAKAFKPVIVLDPGHGGQDSGAVRNGAVEKEVVLQFALKLRDKLNATGRYKVIMTRDTDTFVPLDERRAFSEGQSSAMEGHTASLFIAIHADYAGAQARGATIYSLRDAVANDLKRSAKGELAQNALPEKELRARSTGDASDQSAIKGFLSDLAQTEVLVTKQRTSLFSRAVIEKMGTETTMMSHPDRTAAFRVLKTAKVPAVLIELAYVSNKEDAAKLNSDEWRNKVSASILTAIENYFANQISRFPM